MSLASKLSRAFRHPDEIIPALRCMVERRRVKRIEREDGIYYVCRSQSYPEYLHTGNAAAHILENAYRLDRFTVAPANGCPPGRSCVPSSRVKAWKCWSTIPAAMPIGASTLRPSGA